MSVRLLARGLGTAGAAAAGVLGTQAAYVYGSFVLPPDATGPNSGVAPGSPRWFRRPQRKNIIFIGDSLVSGVGCRAERGEGPTLPRRIAEHVAEELKVDVKWTALGETGASVDIIQHQLLPLLQREAAASSGTGERVDAVVIMCGLNDLKECFLAMNPARHPGHSPPIFSHPSHPHTPIFVPYESVHLYRRHMCVALCRAAATMRHLFFPRESSGAVSRDSRPHPRTRHPHLPPAHSSPHEMPHTDAPLSLPLPPSGAFREQLRDLLESIREATGAHSVMVLPAVPMGEAPRFSNVWPLSQLVKGAASLWEGQKRVLVDSFPPGAVFNVDEPPGIKAELHFCKDGMHPNDCGYELWADHIARGLIQSQVFRT